MAIELDSDKKCLAMLCGCMIEKWLRNVIIQKVRKMNLDHNGSVTIAYDEVFCFVNKKII